MKYKFLFALLLTVATVNAFAVPAFPDKIVFHQPKTEIEVSIFLKGDERVHWAESEDGYSLLHGDDGALYYAMLDRDGNMTVSPYMATNIKERSSEVRAFLAGTPKYLRFSKAQIEAMLKIWKDIENAKSGPKTMSDVIGQKKFLVILFGFSDKHFTLGRNAFKNLFNQVNYNLRGATGSVHDYYYDVSQGLFSLQVDVVGPYVGSREAAYYGDNSGYQDFAKEAVDSAATDVDFSDYDNDGDGYIDGLHIIFAGFGEEAGGGSDCIWSHKWNIFDPPTYNNTIIDVYSCSPEFNGSIGTNITNIGVICHELGHVFGAPDYYDTDYGSSGGQFPGLGDWDIMSGGSWNQGGKTPAQHNPYTKLYIYHWNTCDTLYGNIDQRIIITPAEEALDQVYRINTPKHGDFFLIENRQNIKWDKAIPGHGMLVYHVHSSAHGSSVSNASHPQQIYILAQMWEMLPNSSPSSYGDLSSSGSTYPGTGMRDSLTSNSTPSLRSWTNAVNSVAIRHISENTINKKVYFCLNNANPTPLWARTEGVSNHAITLDWEQHGSYNTLILMSEDSNSFGTPNGLLHVGDTLPDGGIVVYNSGSNSCIVDSLLTNKTYYFKLFSRYGANMYSDGIIVNGTTLNCDGGEWTPEDFESTALGERPTCWTGDWSVDTVAGGHAMTSCTGCQSAAPEWRSTESAPFTVNTTGGAVMSYRLHFSDNCNENTILRVYYKVSPTSAWDTLQSIQWHLGMGTWSQQYVYLPQVSDYSRLRFSVLTDGSTRATIDDVDITAGNLVFASSDGNGYITPRGHTIFGIDDTLTFTLTPLAGYHLANLTIDGASIDPTVLVGDTVKSYSYHFQGSHTVHATFEGDVSIDMAEENVQMKIYPNPTEGIVTIENPAGTETVIYNAMGKLVRRIGTSSGRNTIDISDLPHGIYIIRSGQTTAKVVKL